MTDTLAFTPQLDPDGQPFVLMDWNDERAAFSTTAARRAALALLEAAEQAELEAAMFSWLTRDQGGNDPAAVARILQSFRHHRAEQAGAFTPTEETQ